MRKKPIYSDWGISVFTKVIWNFRTFCQIVFGFQRVSLLFSYMSYVWQYDWNVIDMCTFIGEVHLCQQEHSNTSAFEWWRCAPWCVHGSCISPALHESIYWVCSGTRVILANRCIRGNGSANKVCLVSVRSPSVFEYCNMKGKLWRTLSKLCPEVGLLAQRVEKFCFFYIASFVSFHGFIYNVFEFPVIFTLDIHVAAPSSLSVTKNRYYQIMSVFFKFQSAVRSEWHHHRLEGFLFACPGAYDTLPIGEDC